MSQNGQKPISVMMSLTKNPKPKTKKIFIHCRLEDLPSLLRISTDLWRNPLRSYAVDKTTERSLFSPNFQAQYICIPAVKVIRKPQITHALFIPYANKLLFLAYK